MDSVNWSDVWVSIGQVLSGVLLGMATLFASQAKQWIKKKSVRTDNIVTNNLMLKQLLAEMRSYYDADRVKLYQFHNGDYYSSGASIQKASLTHYVVARGVSPPIGIESTQQNIPIGHIVNTAEEIWKSPYVFYSLERLSEDSYFKGLLRYGGAKSVLLRGVFNAKHDMTGFLVVVWFDPTTLNEEQMLKSQKFSIQIGDELLHGAK